MANKMVPVKFPSNIEEMFENWATCPEENVGWCLLCDGPIYSETDLIPGTNTHNCAEGIKLSCKPTRAGR